MLSDDIVIPKTHIDGIVFFGNELQKFNVGEVIVCNIACDAADICRQEILLKENFEMLAQYAHCAGQWRIEIDMQIADEVVGHIILAWVNSCCLIVKYSRSHCGDRQESVMT